MAVKGSAPLLVFAIGIFTVHTVYSLDKIDLNQLTPEQLATTDFTRKELFFTGPHLKYPNIFAGKRLIGSKLSGLDLTLVGIDKATGLVDVDFTGSTNPPEG